MIHEWSCNIVDLLMAKTKILQASRRLNYCYKVETIIGKIIASVIVFTLGLIIGRPIEAAIFLVVNIKLGDYTGGYHTKNPLRCNLLNTGTFFATLVITDLIVSSYPLILGIVLSALSTLPVFLYAPVNHPDLNLDESEVANARWKARALLACFILSSAIAAFFIPAKYPVSCIVTIAFVSIFIMLAKITKQEVQHHEEGQKNIG